MAGEPDGPYENYYENGQLQSRVTYLMGEYDGPAEAYYENGQLQEKSTYVAGERNGPYEDTNVSAYQLSPDGVHSNHGRVVVG